MNQPDKNEPPKKKKWTPQKKKNAPTRRKKMVHFFSSGGLHFIKIEEKRTEKRFIFLKKKNAPTRSRRATKPTRYWEAWLTTTGNPLLEVSCSSCSTSPSVSEFCVTTYSDPLFLWDMNNDSSRPFFIHACTVCNLIAGGVLRRLQQFILCVPVSCAGGVICDPNNFSRFVCLTGRVMNVSYEPAKPFSVSGLCVSTEKLFKC